MTNILKCIACGLETEAKGFSAECSACGAVMVKKGEYKRAREEYTLAVLEPEGYTNRSRLGDEE